MRDEHKPSLSTLLSATLEVWLLLIAAALLMWTGNKPEAAQAVCGSVADVEALTQAMDQLRAAEAAEQHVRSNGETYVAAKIGPIPGDSLDAEIVQRREDLRRAQHHLAVSVRLCRERGYF